jgi:hypothetical protein
MTEERRYYAVDRVEGDRAILIADGSSDPVDLPPGLLPFRVREAMVLSVPLDARGRPQWDRAVRDEAEERRRLAEGKARLDRLKRRDPGGDVAT